MAQSENQGLQIALIIFVLLALVLGVTTFIFFKQYNEEKDKKVAAIADTKRADTAYGKMSAEYLQVLQLIGPYDVGTPVDKIVENHKQDMDNFASTIPQQTYREAIAALATNLNTENVTLADEKQKTVATQQTVETLEGIKDKLVQQRQAGQEAAQKDLLARQDEFKTSNTTRDQKFSDLQKEWSTRHEDLNKIVSAAKTDLGKVQRDLSLAQGDASDLDKELKKFRGISENVPDGRITWVNQREQKVYIDLGRADNLPRQITFSVHPSGLTQITNEDSTRKGAIEVTKILGDHLAEARIVDVALTDPLLPGDQLFTTLWHPGRSEHYALAGVLDVEGDGRSDREQIRNLIGMAGGYVDDEVLSDGSRTGPGITTGTTFMVLGSSPTAGGAEGDQGRINKSTSEMLGDANRHGVRVISLEEFLDHIGYAHNARIFRPSAGDEYNLRQGTPKPGKSHSGNTSKFFEKRRPASDSGSAYENN